MGRLQLEGTHKGNAKGTKSQVLHQLMPLAGVPIPTSPEKR